MLFLSYNKDLKDKSGELTKCNPFEILFSVFILCKGSEIVEEK